LYHLDTDGSYYELDPITNKPRRLTDEAMDDDKRWDIHNIKHAVYSTGKPPWIIRDLLLGGSATLVSGLPRSMKSLSLLGACLDAIVTGRVWGRFDAPDIKRLLFIETEDPEWMVASRIQGLVKGLGLKDPIEIPGFNYSCVGPFDLLGNKDGLRRLIDRY
jgi:hypothetical protein